MRSFLLVFLTVAVYSVAAIIDGDQIDHSHRSKRYAERSSLNDELAVPIDFQVPSAAVPHSRLRKRFLLGRDENIMPIRSHFREYGISQRDQIPDDPIDMDEPRRIHLTRQQPVSVPVTPSLAAQLASQIAPMSQDELNAWVLLLNSYGLTGGKTQNGRPGEDYQLPVAIQTHSSSAHTAHRAIRPAAAGREQPASLDNYPDIKFLSKRAKRVESGKLDPQDEPRALPLAPAKKSIDWSEYFGIDKKSTSASTVPTVNEVTTKAAAEVANKAPAGRTTVDKVPKKLKDREENESENKADRKWILSEFYKNLAMATNVRRKRATSSGDFFAVAKEMKEQGDKILGDAIKFGGQTDNGAALTPQQLAAVKQDIISQLAKAYDFAKIQKVLQAAGEQLGQLSTNNISQ